MNIFCKKTFVLLTSLVALFFSKIRSCLIDALCWITLYFPTRVHKVIVVPEDLRTCDPTFADDVYAGIFAFGGRTLVSRGHSPMDYLPPSQAWADEFYGFSWLRHLRAANTELTRANAKAYVNELIHSKKVRQWSEQPHVVSDRIYAFLSQSPLILYDSDRRFYKQFMRRIDREVRMLEWALLKKLDDEVRLKACISLCYAALCCQGLHSILRRSVQKLTTQLQRQIRNDGGHVSRNPQVSLELLLHLLPLKQIFLNLNLQTPHEMMRAIDTMIAFLRMMAHGDTALAHFNGCGRVEPDYLMNVLRYDKSYRPDQVLRASSSGYERLEKKRSVVIMDVGRNKVHEAHQKQCAGTLSFEFSSGPARIVINCGFPDTRLDLQPFARTSAAHSTMIVNNTSSSRFLNIEGRGLYRALTTLLVNSIGTTLISAPQRVDKERLSLDDFDVLVARHDGYSETFGITHERRWSLHEDGEVLKGEDAIVYSDTQAPQTYPIAIRFHLHPSVDPESQDDHILCKLINGEVWSFHSSVPAQIEESVYFSGLRQTQSSKQLVIHYAIGQDTVFSWEFRHIIPDGH